MVNFLREHMLFKIISVCKGGGYRYCRTEPPHPKRNANGLYPLHRVLVENKVGRLLEAGEDVHHVDENKANDSIENLQIISKSEHTAYHRRKLVLSPIELKCKCGSAFYVKPHDFRRRIKNSKFGRVFCSRRCSGKYG